MDIQYSPNSFSSFNIYSLSSEWIHHPLWGKRWTHWHQGCSAREDSRHTEISSHATSSCQKCWFCFSKYSTDHELSRRNTKEISKVPRKWFGIWKKNSRDTWMLPEHTFWMWSLGNYEPGSEKLSSAIQPNFFHLVTSLAWELWGLQSLKVLHEEIPGKCVQFNSQENIKTKHSITLMIAAVPLAAFYLPLVLMIHCQC